MQSKNFSKKFQRTALFPSCASGKNCIICLTVHIIPLPAWNYLSVTNGSAPKRKRKRPDIPKPADASSIDFSRAIFYSTLMEQSARTEAVGCGPLAIIIIIFVIIAAILGINIGIEAYSLKCTEDEPIWDCLQRRDDEEALTEDQKKSVVTASGPYSYEDYSITLTMKIPLSGGPVTGSISGACKGRVKGNFGGQNNSAITGTISGFCNPFYVNVPAKATFTGAVNKDSKAVPIKFSGGGAGFSHEGSMSLGY